MSSKKNHELRSHKTYRYRMAAARYYCNYSLTRAERLMMQARFAAAMRPQSMEIKNE